MMSHDDLVETRFVKIRGKLIEAAGKQLVPRSRPGVGKHLQRGFYISVQRVTVACQDTHRSDGSGQLARQRAWHSPSEHIQQAFVIPERPLKPSLEPVEQGRPVKLQVGTDRAGVV